MTFEEYEAKTHEIINEVNDLCNSGAVINAAWDKQALADHLWATLNKVEAAAVYPEVGHRCVMTRDDIDHVICKIMREDGPDGHVDGHDVITDFIVALLDGQGEEWNSSYRSKRQKLDDDPEYQRLVREYPEAFA